MARLWGYQRPRVEVEVGADGPASAPLSGAAAAAPPAGAVAPQSLPPAVQWCLVHGVTTEANSKALFESYLLSFRFSMSSNGVSPSVVLLVKPAFEDLVGCVLSFRGRATKLRASAEAAWVALLSFPRLVLRPMADLTSAGHVPFDSVADYRNNRFAHWAS
jgi:hypothetical protein